MMLLHCLCGDTLIVRPVFATRVATNDAEHAPRERNPGDCPSRLVVGVVLIEVRCLGVVHNADEDAETVDNEEGKLRKEGQA